MIIWRAQSFLGWIVAQTLNRAAYCDNALPLWLECTHTHKHTDTYFLLNCAPSNTHACRDTHLEQKFTFSRTSVGCNTHTHTQHRACGEWLEPADKTEWSTSKQ